jgi:hypothetical protein
VIWEDNTEGVKSVIIEAGVPVHCVCDTNDGGEWVPWRGCYPLAPPKGVPKEQGHVLSRDKKRKRRVEERGKGGFSQSNERNVRPNPIITQPTDRNK